jgi:GlpG protein
MRAIGQLPDEPKARRLGDYLLVQGLPNQVERDESGRWTLWIHDDDHLAQGQAILAEFLRQPNDPKYRRAGPSAQELRQQEEEAQKVWRKRLVDRRSLWRGGPVRPGVLASILCAVCIAVGVVQYLQGPNAALVRLLQISEYSFGAGGIYYSPGLPEVRAGQVWRLVTPIFLHFGFFHLLFNVLWLLDLGSMIEERQGRGKVAALVCLIAAFSNLGQYYVGGPAFGGMSGVVYGLFGYIWVRSKLDPRSGLFIDSTSVMLMVVWFIVCMTGMVGPVANMAHAAGLGLGLVWGYLAAKLNRGD